MVNRSKRGPITYGRNPTASKRRRQVDLTLDDDDFLETVDMGFVPDTLSTDRLVPTRPTSQAAAMSSEPSEDLINTIVSFAGVERPVAIRALKVKNNNPDAALNAIFEGEDLEKAERDMGWNEGLMNNVQPLGASAAPTRGNSPVGSMRQPNNQEEEDHQMAAAMAASQQETGVISGDGTSSNTMIGPLNQNSSYASQWAMVKYGAQEVLADVEIAQRVQDKDAAEPRLLKHLTDGDYTPNLLTICHAIPAAREALLMKSWLKHDYGYDEGWWRGQPIATPTVVHVVDGSPADTLADNQEGIIEEVQRLMAFLSSSDRIYASTGGLTETKLIKQAGLSGGSLLELFVKSWTSAAESKNAAGSGMFTTKMGPAEAMDTPNMTVAEITVRPGKGGNKDLSELLDDLFWDKDLEEDNYIDQPADVFVVTLKQGDPETKRVSVDVPASLHLDKYLEENLASSCILRNQMQQARHKLAKIEAIEDKLTTWSYFDSHKAEKLEQERKAKLEKEKGQIGPKESTKAINDEIDYETNNAQVAVKDLLTHSLAHFSGENRKEADATDIPPKPDPPEFSDIAAKLERVMTSIEDKLRQLSVNKEKTRSSLSDISKSPPLHADGGGPRHRYTLRGVATKPSITYVLSPRSNEDVEMNDGQDATTQIDLEDSTPPGMQWWRLAYESNGSSATIHRTKAADYDVLRAVELEHDSALLVYASDRAIAALPTDPSNDLPDPLQEFITRDNHQFKLDLAAAKRDPPDYISFNTGGIRDSIEPNEKRRKGSDSSLQGNAPDSPVAAEIHLTPETDGVREVEMVQRVDASPLTLGDTAMGGGGVASSEMKDGGGAQHVEDTDTDTKMME